MGKSDTSGFGSFANDVAGGLGSQNFYDPDRALFQRDLAYEMYGPGAATGSQAAGTNYGSPGNPYNPGPPGGTLGVPIAGGGDLSLPGSTAPIGTPPPNPFSGDDPRGIGGNPMPGGDPVGGAGQDSGPGPGGGTGGGGSGGGPPYSRTTKTLGGRDAQGAQMASISPQGAMLSGRDAQSAATGQPPGRMPITRATGTQPSPQTVPSRQPTYDDITNPLGGGAPGGGGPGGGLAGQRDAAGNMVLGGLSSMYQNPEIAQNIKNSIQQEGALTTQAGFAGAGGDIRRNAAATGNTAGTAAALAQLGRNEGGALGDLSRRNAISFENEAQRRRESALSGLSNYYGQASSNFNTLAGLRGAIAASPVGTGTQSRTLNKGVKRETTDTGSIQWI